MFGDWTGNAATNGEEFIFALSLAAGDHAADAQRTNAFKSGGDELTSGNAAVCGDVVVILVARAGLGEPPLTSSG